jgi:hypothetical protein
MIGWLVGWLGGWVAGWLVHRWSNCHFKMMMTLCLRQLFQQQQKRAHACTPRPHSKHMFSCGSVHCFTSIVLEKTILCTEISLAVSNQANNVLPRHALGLPLVNTSHQPQPPPARPKRSLLHSSTIPSVHDASNPFVQCWHDLLKYVALPQSTCVQRSACFPPNL